MSDLISRADAIEEIRRLPNAGIRWFVSAEAVFDVLLSLPSAEPKHGKWIDMGDFEQCSVCMATHLKTIQTVYGKVTWIKSDYCPACGARMDVDRDSD